MAYDAVSPMPYALCRQKPYALSLTPCVTFPMASSAMKSMAAAFKRGAPASAYYLYGPEDALKDDAIRYILDQALDPAMRDFNLDQVSAGTLDPEAIEALCSTVPMMAARRVVIIRDVEQWKRRTKGRSAVVRYLAKPSPETVLLLVQGAADDNPDKELLKHATPIECAVTSPAEAGRWLDRRAAERGITFGPGAREHLLTTTARSLSAIGIELEKLASLPAGVEITVAQVGDLVGIRHGETPLDWRDAVLDDNPAQGLSLLSLVLDQPGVNGVRLVSLLGSTLIGVGITRAAWEKGQRGQALEKAAFAAMSAARPGGLRTWSMEAAQWAEWAPRWPAPRISAALAAALDADRALKSTTVSSEQAILSDLIMRMAIEKPAISERQ